jgi:hypothetical protein
MPDRDAPGPWLALALEHDVNPNLAQRGSNPSQHLPQIGWPLGPAFCLLLALGHNAVEGF